MESFGPSKPLPLKEHQHVRVTVSDVPAGRADAWIDHEYMASIDAIEEPEPTIDEVRHILSKVPGNFSDDIRAERDSRG